MVLDPPLNAQGNPGLLVCPGILIDYVINSLTFVPNPSGDVYAFDATVFFQNIGNVNLVNWRVSIGYQWNELITRVGNLTLPPAAATPLPGAPLLPPPCPAAAWLTSRPRPPVPRLLLGVGRCPLRLRLAGGSLGSPRRSGLRGVAALTPVLGLLQATRRCLVRQPTTPRC